MNSLLFKGSMSDLRPGMSKKDLLLKLMSCALFDSESLESDFTMFRPCGRFEVID